MKALEGRLTPLVLTAVIGLVVGFGLGAVLVDGNEGGGEGDGGRPGLPPNDLGEEGVYIALGDSYSAGEGLRTYEAGTEDLPIGDRCHRSPQYAYPQLLEFVHATTVVHRACSGALIDHVFKTVQTHDHTPNFQGHQIEPEPDTPDEPATITDDVLLVTLTMGGNDLHFADMLVFCVVHKSCMDDEFLDSGKPLAQWADDGLDEIQSQLVALYKELRARVPAAARILVLGYPGLFPERVPPLFSDAFCHEALQAWGGPERDAIRNWNVRLDAIIQSAANEAGVEYVDVYSFFVQHETCGPAGAWIKFVGNPSRVERDGWFHPTRDGQYMMARIVACYLHVFHSFDEAIARDPTHVFEMSSCVADTYPTGGGVSLPTPS